MRKPVMLDDGSAEDDSEYEAEMMAEAFPEFITYVDDERLTVITCYDIDLDKALAWLKEKSVPIVEIVDLDQKVSVEGVILGTVFYHKDQYHGVEYIEFFFSTNPLAIMFKLTFC